MNTGKKYWYEENQRKRKTIKKTKWKFQTVLVALDISMASKGYNNRQVQQEWGIAKMTRLQINTLKDSVENKGRIRNII